MARKAATGTDPDESLLQFLRYSALVTAHTPGSRRAEPRRIPVRLAYSVMNAVARTLLACAPEALKGEIEADLTLSRAAYLDAMTVDWVGTEDQREKTAEKLEVKGFVREIGAHVVFSAAYIKRILDLSREVFAFFTGRTTPAGWVPSSSDWLKLHEATVRCFFLGDFGSIWRLSREEIQSAVRSARREKNPKQSRKRPYRGNPLNDEAELWVVLNLLVIFESVHRNSFSELALIYGFDELAGKLSDIEKGLDSLVAASIATVDEHGWYRIHPRHSEHLAKYREELPQGMAALRLCCERWDAGEAASG